MNPIPWGKYAALLRIMMQVVEKGPELKTPRPVERCPLTPEVEAKTDLWLKDWIQTGNRNPPDDLRYSIFVRLDYAAQFAARCESVGIPLPKSGEDAVLEEILIHAWHRDFRQLWEKEGDSFSA